MAFFRALESSRAADQQLFADPFAQGFISGGLSSAVRLAQRRWLAGVVEWCADWRLPGARTSGIARTRLIDDMVSGLASEGCRQVVILGAGFDCRALRLAYLENKTVFEVDHPATLRRKVRVLKEIKATVKNVRYVEIDFNRQCLAERLKGAGFQNSKPTIFLWEGVTNYLTPSAVEGVLRYIAAGVAGTHVIFTYVEAGLLDWSVEFKGAKRLMRDVEKLIEPWIFGLKPEGLAEFLKGNGLTLDMDYSAREYRRCYYGRAAERMEGYEFYHVATAHV